MGDIQPDPFAGPDLARFPNTRLRASAPDAPTDSTRAAPADVALLADPDTCRICRGEGTPEEPLFYPCKCSGSIKYVHQDCLMEWLSHSQKKHCELCKTPFRFTKLYAPDMPKALPIHVFVSHMAKYIFRNILVWLRAALVASVWFGWLPYLMRSVWSFLFWISDEGLGGGGALFGRQNGAAGGAADAYMAAQGTCPSVCPSSPLFAATTTVATVGGVMDGLSLDSLRIVKSLYNINLTSTDPLYLTILRLFFSSMSPGEKAAAATSSNATVNIIEKVAKGVSPLKTHPTLLSEVSFLRNLTRHASINRTLIATLEGQIITILVIVCFILIILVRDYVVQQQPDIMRAAFAPAENVAPVENLMPPAPPPRQPARRLAAGGLFELAAEPELPRVVNDDDDDEDDDEDDDDDVDNPTIEELDIANNEDHGGDDGHTPGTWDYNILPTGGYGGSSGIFPDQPPNPASEGDPTTVKEFVTMWRETGGDTEEMVKAARELKIEDKLEYWINIQRQTAERGGGASSSGTGGVDVAESVAGVSTTAQVGTPTSSHQSSGWTLPDEQPAWNEDADRKGKGKLANETEYPYDPMDLDTPPRSDGTQHLEPELMTGSPMRQRAYTDGPKINDSINPLANNNWSFTNLPDDHSLSSARSSFDEASLDNRRSEAGPSQQPSPSGGQEGRPSRVTSGNDQGQRNAHQSQDDRAVPEPPTQQEDIPRVDAATPRQPGDAQPPRRNPGGLFGAVADFMWRDVDAIDPAELVGVVEPLDNFGDDDDDDFVVAEDDVLDGELERDREVVEAAVAAGLDPEAIEDAEDLEGILELLGMRGPVAGLFQNAIFCAFLVSITIFVGIFAPYNIGRLAVWTLANPVRPARMLFSLSKLIQDCAVIMIGFTSAVVSATMVMLGYLVPATGITKYFSSITANACTMAFNASNRIASSFMTDLPFISTSEMRNFSAISHEALHDIRGHIGLLFSTLVKTVAFVFGGDYSSKSSEVVGVAANISAAAWDVLKEVPVVITHPSSWVINFSVPEPTALVDPDLAYWNGMDRFWAIVCGYVALSLMAGLYLRRGAPFSSSQATQEREAVLIDGLNQASGVMKVVLIIGIEMLIFPLYCGMLLDIALLPLFENASVNSRILFTVNYPVTSIFVHWFVGTGYMFHFALFVSMCRKIMRKGVLYFIRDPDDPEFHPVRDVLERSVTTQLRKILFSAFVYGALVIICLGGVVWSLAWSLPNVLPIHYSSNEPVLEFPIDLLFYNFLMPLAVKFFKPSDGLHAMYTWWFRKCARALRITWFLFGERRVDEEGHLRLQADSPHRNGPWWSRLFLELDGHEVVPKTWNDIFEGGTAKPAAVIGDDEMVLHSLRKRQLVNSGQLIPDGLFVRTPASDQVKVPKGQRVFLEVDENNRRKEGRDNDVYAGQQYQFVYVPPHFRARVFLFIMYIWIFAAATGVGMTIIPLIFGRQMFKLLIPSHIRTNDIYAFSIGVYVLSTVAYCVVRLPSIYRSAKTWLTATATSALNQDTVKRISGSLLAVAKVFYAYFFLFVAFPLMVASLMELYAIIPLHEVMYSPLLAGEGDSAAPGNVPAELNPRHTIRVIQGWTVGLLYLRLSSRVIVSWFDNTRLAAAVRAVLRRGWLDPDLTVLTRAFVIPGVALWVFAVVMPLMCARLTIANGLADAMMQSAGAPVASEPFNQQLYDAYLVLVYRLSYPCLALSSVAFFALLSLVDVFRGWKVRIRDEAYLIGERLHNFGVVNTPPKARGAWRAGGPRLG